MMRFTFERRGALLIILCGNDFYALRNIPEYVDDRLSAVRAYMLNQQPMQAIDFERWLDSKWGIRR